jgi:hypothetical protein
MKARLELRLFAFFTSKLYRDVWSDSLSDRFQRRKFPQFSVERENECFPENVWLWQRNKYIFQSPNQNPIHFIIWFILIYTELYWIIQFWNMLLLLSSCLKLDLKILPYAKLLKQIFAHDHSSSFYGFLSRFTDFVSLITGIFFSDIKSPKSMFFTQERELDFITFYSWTSLRSTSRKFS